MTAAKKTVNYTPEQTAEMVEAYLASPTKETVAALAEKLGKTVRSITAKLTVEKVYVSAEYKNKNGEKPITREKLAEKLGDFFGLSEGEVDSLAKVNKTALAKILAKIEA